MAFDTMDTYGLPSFRSYFDAKMYHDRIKPIRGRDVDIRPLDKSRRRNHMNILKRGEDIICRLYDTDVVVFHPDNSVTLTPWVSMTTDKFANKILGCPGIWAWFNQGGSHYCAVNIQTPDGDRIVRPKGATRFVPGDNYTWTVDPTQLVPFKHIRVNTKRANAALKAHGYKEFALWFKAYAALCPASVPRWPARRYNNAGLLTMLAEGVESWPQIVEDRGKHSLDALREGIYRADKCYDVTEHMSVTRQNYDAIVASERKYRWSV